MNMDTNTKKQDLAEGDANPTRLRTQNAPSKKAARITVFTAVLLASVSAAVLGVPWLVYRQNHTILGNAQVRGTVAKLGARIDGQVKQVFVSPGQRVMAGETLLQFEDDHLQAAVQREQAEMESAVHELQAEKLAIAQERRRLALEVDRLSSLRKSTIAAQEGEASNLEKLDKDFARIISLMREGIAAGSELDRITGDRGKAQAAVRSAQAVREAAEASYQSAQVSLEAVQVREARLAVLEARIAMARARIASVKADLSASIIRAPQDGWILDRIQEPGGAAKAGDPLIAMWVGQSWIEAWLDENQLDRIRIGSEVDVSLSAFPGRAVRGRVEALGLMASKELYERAPPSALNSFVRKSSMVPVRIAMADGTPQLQPGLSAIVGIEREGRKTPLFAGTFLARWFSQKPTAPVQQSRKQ